MPSAKVFSTRLIHYVLILAVSTLTSVASAFEGRHAVDPSVSLDGLRNRNGVPIIRKDRAGGRIMVDSSAVLRKVSVERLLSESLKFDEYVAMGMPHLKASRIVRYDQAENMIHVWSHMVLSAVGIPLASKHYLRVHKLPTGSEWELQPKRPEWSFPEDPAMDALDGSWFVTSTGADEAYVRYWLSMDPNVAAPIVDTVVGSQLQSGVQKVIEALARRAAL
jgi:hypothetical protein